MSLHIFKNIYTISQAGENIRADIIIPAQPNIPVIDLVAQENDAQLQGQEQGQGQNNDGFRNAVQLLVETSRRNAPFPYYEWNDFNIEIEDDREFLKAVNSRLKNMSFHGKL